MPSGGRCLENDRAGMVLAIGSEQSSGNPRHSDREWSPFTKVMPERTIVSGFEERLDARADGTGSGGTQLRTTGGTEHMLTTSPCIEMDRLGATVVVRPCGDLGEFTYIDLEQEIASALRRIDNHPGIRNVVVDLEDSDYFGSSAIGLFVRLWKCVRSRQGKMAMCHLSEHEAEVLHVSDLDSLWPICSDLEAALHAVGETARPR